jgi:hypothetical protein
MNNALGGVIMEMRMVVEEEGKASHFVLLLVGAGDSDETLIAMAIVGGRFVLRAAVDGRRRLRTRLSPLSAAFDADVRTRKSHHVADVHSL